MVHSVASNSRQALLAPVAPLSENLEDYWGPHRQDYERNDFITPFVSFMETAASSDLTFQQQRDWVLQVHQAACEECFTDETLRTIAETAGPFLFDQIYTRFTEDDPDSFVCPALTYDSSLTTHPKVSEDSKKRVIFKLKLDFAQDLQKGNPISFFVYIFNLPSRVLWHGQVESIFLSLVTETLTELSTQKENHLDLRKAACYQALAKPIYDTLDQAKTLSLFRPPRRNLARPDCCIIL